MSKANSFFIELCRTAVLFTFGFYITTSALPISKAFAYDEFGCESQHGGPSVIRVERGKSVKFKKLPVGEWKAAKVLDSGRGWITYRDGWGFWGEDSTKHRWNSSISCEKYTNPCNATIKFFEYGGENQGWGYKLTDFTEQNCCLYGEDMEKGAQTGFEHCKKY